MTRPYEWWYIRTALRERCGGYCEACGWPLPDNEWAAHHRLRKAQGGKDTMDNLVALHHHCHNIVPGSVHQEPQMAFSRGLLVHMGSEPSEVPLRLPDESWVFLSTVYTPCDPPEDTDAGPSAHREAPA